MSKTPEVTKASAKVALSFPTVIEVKNRLKNDRDTFLYGSDKTRHQEILQVVSILENKLSPESTALDSLNWLFAYRRFVILTGVAESIAFTATIPYDAELLNGPLATGRWNVHFDPFTRTIEVSTENLSPVDDSDM